MLHKSVIIITGGGGGGGDSGGVTEIETGAYM